MKESITIGPLRRINDAMLMTVFSIALLLCCMPATALAEESGVPAVEPLAVEADEPSVYEDSEGLDLVDDEESGKETVLGEDEEIVQLGDEVASGDAIELLDEDGAEHAISLGTQATVVASGTWGTCAWDVSSDGTLTIHAGTGAEPEEDGADGRFPWDTLSADVRAIVLAEGTRLPEDCSRMFAGMALESVDLSGCDSSGVRDATGMFAGCSNVASIRLGSSYEVLSTDMLPKASSSRVEWWSVTEGAWFSVVGIASQRSGIADTYVRKADVSTAKVTLSASKFVYDGKAKTPVPTVMLGKTRLVAGTDYQVSYRTNKEAGTASVVISAKGDYAGSVAKGFSIAKAANTLAVARKQSKISVTYNASKATSTARNFNVSGSVGTVTYANASADAAKKLKVNKSSGKVTVPKGTKAGTYVVKVRVTAAGNANYKAGSKSVSYKIKVGKAANPMTAKAGTSTGSQTVLLQKKGVIAGLIKVSKAKGKLTYQKVSGPARLTINKKSGSITVKRNTKPGTYALKAKVTAAGTANYKSKSKAVTCKVVVVADALTNTKALLDFAKRYDKDGHYILSAMSSKGYDVTAWWGGSKFIPDVYGTAVHEECHRLTSNGLWNQMRVYVGSGKSVIVPIGKRYRSLEMASSIPSRLRTFRYDTYIGSPSPNLSSDVEGVYGLLNEFTAYCWGTTSDFRLYNYYKKFRSIDSMMDYVSAAASEAVAYAEFRYYIEHYLLYAKRHHKDVYNDVMGNRKFLEALRAVDVKFSTTIASYDKSFASMEKLLKKNGCTVRLSGDYLWFKGGGSGSRGVGIYLNEYNVLVEELNEPAYKAIEKALSVKAVSWRMPL